jgi:hypothetical protein
MKSISLLILFIGLLSSAEIVAQNCEPDEIYVDSAGGVYPRPVSDSLPEAGIDKIACIGQEYYFNFTVVVPDTILFNGVPLVVTRIRLRTTEPITGLPVGLSHQCEPANCDMLSGTLGCIALVGIPDEVNEPGEYPLIIKVDIVTSFGAIPTEFPNPALAPGQYIITLEEGNSEACMSSSIINPKTATPLMISPNPGINSDELYIHMPDHVSGSGSISFTDLSGKKIRYITQESIRGIWKIDTSTIPSGVYIVEMKTEKESFIAKFIR